MSRIRSSKAWSLSLLSSTCQGLTFLLQCSACRAAQKCSRTLMKTMHLETEDCTTAEICSADGKARWHAIVTLPRGPEQVHCSLIEAVVWPAEAAPPWHSSMGANKECLISTSRTCCHCCSHSLWASETGCSPQFLVLFVKLVVETLLCVPGEVFCSARRVAQVEQASLHDRDLPDDEVVLYILWQVAQPLRGAWRLFRSFLNQGSSTLSCLMSCTCSSLRSNCCWSTALARGLET